MTVCPMWACTTNTIGDPDNCALLHVLTHAQLAVRRALEFKATEPVAQLLCLFNSVHLKEEADTLLFDLIGFEQGTSPTDSYAIFERDRL